ncbi:hypothetical protein PAMA_000085 [Pampus argenteus]
MDNTFHHGPPEQQPPPAYHGAYVDPAYTAGRAPPAQDLTAPRWTASQGYDGHSFGFRCDFPPPSPGVGGFGAPNMAPPYAFDPSVPPPPLGCPPPGHFPNIVPHSPGNAYNNSGAAFHPFNQHFKPGPQTNQYDFHPAVESSQKHQQEYESFSERGALFGHNSFLPRVRDNGRSLGTTTQPQHKDETALQRQQDEHWVKHFLQTRGKSSKKPRPQQSQQISVPELRDALHSAAQLLSQLSQSCESLKHNMDTDCVWTHSYQVALNVKTELQEKMKVLSDSKRLSDCKAKLSRIAKKRARRLRARKQLEIEEKEREARMAEKEAAIDKWRMKRIHDVEEKKKEQELKLAADSVLCEVRKKQADVKRMQDILRSLEKLRKLRKEAASRKGIITDRESDEAFGSRLEKLRCVMKKRTAIYSVEEKALMVMLEGEQEEERRRDLEKRLKKERERQLQRKHKVDSMLFGDEIPANPVLQPYRDYYTQAEHSLHSLVQIRREWDSFLVAADHPDGTVIPQNWVLPDAPSDHAWASALLSAECDSL